MAEVIWPSEDRAAEYWQAEQWIDEQETEGGVPEPDEDTPQVPGARHG